MAIRYRALQTSSATSVKRSVLEARSKELRTCPRHRNWHAVSDVQLHRYSRSAETTTCRSHRKSGDQGSRSGTCNIKNKGSTFQSTRGRALFLPIYSWRFRYRCAPAAFLHCSLDNSVYSSLLLLPGKTCLSCNSDFRILYTSRHFSYRKLKNKGLRWGYRPAM